MMCRPARRRRVMRHYVNTNAINPADYTGSCRSSRSLRSMAGGGTTKQSAGSTCSPTS